MNILITGSEGFIGRNLIEKLKENQNYILYEYDINTQHDLLDYFCETSDFIFHFAAVHRPSNLNEYSINNICFFSNILKRLQYYNNRTSILYTSSIQAIQDNEYGKSKKIAEEALFKHSEIMKSKSIIYRLTNIFGKYAKPNSHSVVATFCYNLIHNLPIHIDNPEKIITFNYIDDVVNHFLIHLTKSIYPDQDGFYRLSTEFEYSITVKELADTLRTFHQQKKELVNELLENDFLRKLYETYLYYKNS